VAAEIIMIIIIAIIGRSRKKIVYVENILKCGK